MLRTHSVTETETSSSGEVCPIIDSEVFAASDSSLAFVKIDSVGAACEFYSEFQGMARLRADVYLREKYLTAESYAALAGSETDLDDGRSVHFIALERLADSARTARVVGCMRLIVKYDGRPLPVETLCADRFPGGAAHQSAEASRLVARIPDRRRQAALKWPMFAWALDYAERARVPHVFGLLKPTTCASFQQQGLPFQALGDAQFIPEINSVKQAVEIDLAGLRSVVSHVRSVLPGGTGNVLYL